MAKKIAKPSALPALKAAIRDKNPDRLYFFHGEETFLLHYYLERLQKILIEKLTESFNFHKLNNESFDLQSFADAVENLPMMAEHTMVWVDEVDIFKLPETDRNKLTEVLEDIPDYCTVVFTFETTPWKPDKRLKKLWSTVETKATVVEFSKQELRDLIPWVGRHFAAAGKKISAELCNYLIDITGGTMTALSGEIGKICSYAEGPEITRADIDAVTEPVLDAVVFQMTDLMGQGDYGAALQKLRELLKMQQEPLSILGAIGAHFRRLGAARTMIQCGKSASELMRLCGMTEYAAKKNMQAAKRFSERFCRSAAALILETDARIKTSYDEPERLLELLVLQLAQEAKHD